MPSLLLFELTGFVLGLLFGSFLNVCISRLPRHESVVYPASHCPSCSHPIRWYDNIPLLSWIALRARCRDCKSRISWCYPAIELMTGLWFCWASIEFFWSMYEPIRYPTFFPQWFMEISSPVAFAILGFLLIGLLVMDWQTQRLPDAFTLPGIALGFLFTCVQAIFLAPGEGQILLPAQHLRLRSPGVGAVEGNVFLTGPEALIFGRIAVILGAALILLAVRWIYKAIRKQDGMGLGDVKLLAMIAAFLGFSQSLLALFAGVLAASLYGILLLTTGKGRRSTRIPFGSFLAAGGLLAALIGPQIIDWYAGLIR